MKNSDETLDTKLNDELEWAWYDFGKAMNGYLTIDGGMGHNDFDALILRTLLIDGEVFIRIHHPNNKYGLSFELVDSAAIDFTKRRDFSNGSAIFMGIEIDENYRPIKYYTRKGTLLVYQAGKEEEIPASEMIHIYKREFSQQTRGIPPFNSCLQDLKNLEDYRLSEILAAKAGSCVASYYVPINGAVKGDFIAQQTINQNGEFAKTLEPFMSTVVPDGYNVQTFNPTHPNSGYDAFTKSILTQLAASLGISYAKLLKDYGAVNYSSLREGTLDEAAFYAEQQSFIIESWKEIEFRLFIEALALLPETIIKPSQVKDILMHHTWVTQKRPYFDKGKDILGDERELRLGLKSPLMIMEANGDDPEEILRSWKQYETMCKAYGLSFPVTEKDEKPLSSEDKDFNDEANQDDALNHSRD